MSEDESYIRIEIYGILVDENRWVYYNYKFCFEIIFNLNMFLYLNIPVKFDGQVGPDEDLLLFSIIVSNVLYTAIFT